MSAPVPPPPPVTPPFSSVVPGRYPEQKTHSDIRYAKTAVGPSYLHRPHMVRGEWCCRSARGGQIYEWTGTEWRLLFDVQPGSPSCELPWRKS